MMKRQHEHGVALLLALGVLSLLLVSGLAFVTNALLAQKSAAAYRFRSQSQLLGKSAVNRVMMLMRYYLAQGDDEGIGELYSRSNADINGQSGDIPAAAEQDQLTPSANSLLTALVDNNSRSAPTTPRWEYLWDAYNSSGQREADAKLVGRFAYWILPGGTVNFSEILRGNPGLGTGYSMSNWTRRRGFGIRELNISGSSYLDNNRLNELDDPFADETYGTADPRQQDSNRANDYATFVSMFNSKPNLALANRNVIRRLLPPSGSEEEVYFVLDSGETYDKETFNPHRTGNLKKYHRFDLTRTDWTRLGHNTDIANSDDLVKRLLGIGLTDTDFVAPAERAADASINDDTRDEDLPERTNSIPALRRIHDVAGPYGSLTTRRKQIAANLIDYCDADSIPTSDSPKWEDNAPSYTGNEKTPYINEIMIGPSISVTRQETAIPGAEGAPTTYTYSYDAIIDLRMAAVELINMYGLNFPDCDIALKGEYTLEITVDDQETKSLTVAFDFPLKGTPEPFEAGSINGRYATKVVFTEDPANAAVTRPVWSTITTAAVETKRTDPLTVKVTMTSLKIEKVHLKIAGSAAEGDNADFVRDLEADTSAAPVMQAVYTATAADAESTIEVYPHVGFEVDDPRENLYRGSGTDEATMNWRKITEMSGKTKLDHNVDTTTLPDAIKNFTFNERNNDDFCKPANTDPAVDKDLESATNPEDVSSAHIADAPMKTLVELGAIHRAAKWQTINLRASRSNPSTQLDHGINDAGDTYQQGDAWILDHVKLTDRVRVPHRLYLNNPPGTDTQESELLYAALFRGLVWNWDKHYHYDMSDGTAIGDPVTAGEILAGRAPTEKFFSRAELIHFASGGNRLWNAYGQITPATDAGSETVPALVSGLISFFPRSPDPVTMILAAQSIRDVGTTTGFTMSKLRNDGSGNSESTTVQSGRFDFVNNMYFDEITGTSRYYVEIGTQGGPQPRVNLLRFEPLD